MRLLDRIQALKALLRRQIIKCVQLPVERFGPRWVNCTYSERRGQDLDKTDETAREMLRGLVDRRPHAFGAGRRRPADGDLAPPAEPGTVVHPDWAASTRPGSSAPAA